MPRSFLEGLLFHWLENYDDVLNAAIGLLYAQIVVGLVGSLGNKATGVLSAGVAVSLFGLVAIASGYQTLGRAYAALLGGMVILDTAWLFLYLQEFVDIVKAEGFWSHNGFSSALVLLASATALLLRLLSAALWFQMFRLGWAASDVYSAGPGASPFFSSFRDFDQSSRGRQSADHSPRVTRQHSHSNEFLGASIFYPPSFAALVQHEELNEYLREDAVSGSQASTESVYEPPAIIHEEQEWEEPKPYSEHESSDQAERGVG